MSPYATPPPWPEHPDDTKVIARNVARLDAEIQAQPGSREAFTLALPLQWHTQIHAGCTHVPVPEYVGHYRGSALPHLENCPVFFGPFTGNAAGEVARELSAFENGLQGTLTRLDAALPDAAAATPSRLNVVLEAMASHYATWLRIHPFADGNGRTARILANWVMVRYWQPLILPGRPTLDAGSLHVATTPAIQSKDYRLLVIHLRKRLKGARAAAALTPGAAGPAP